MVSETVENYLKALYSLEDGNHEVSLSDLSMRLSVSKPTVNNMIKTLDQKGWVYYEKYKPVKLTPAGRKAATLIIRRHRLTEMYLVEKMGFGWEEVHEIAEQIEHIKSPAFFDRMDELMDYPKVDPHGSPIPDKAGNIIDRNVIKLSECKVGDHVIIVALNESDRSLLQFLNSREISLGCEMHIELIEPFDQSMVVSYRAHPRVSLSQKVGERLFVEKT